MNLEAAFALQLRRIEAEWGAHEQQMTVDYMAQKSEIEGRQVAPSQVLSLAGPWKSKEKQSRLIHTAPVQSPDSKALQPLTPLSELEGRGVEGRGVERRGLTEDDACNDASETPSATGRSAKESAILLQRLEGAYSVAKTRVKHQKANAVRWIHRQSSRMLMQVNASDRVKKLTAQFLEREETSLAGASLRVEAFVQLLVDEHAEHNSLPPVLPPALRPAQPDALQRAISSSLSEPSREPLSSAAFSQQEKQQGGNYGGDDESPGMLRSASFPASPVTSAHGDRARQASPTIVRRDFRRPNAGTPRKDPRAALTAEPTKFAGASIDKEGDEGGSAEGWATEPAPVE